jgi:hypothetical protein
MKAITKELTEKQAETFKGLTGPAVKFDLKKVGVNPLLGQGKMMFNRGFGVGGGGVAPGFGGMPGAAPPAPGGGGQPDKPVQGGTAPGGTGGGGPSEE